MGLRAMELALKRQLVDEILCVADSKWVLGHWYIKVLRNGRGLQDYNALSGMAQDVLGHTRSIFSFLEDRLDQPEGHLEFERPATEIASIEVLDAPPVDWTDFVVTMYLTETAIWQHLATFRNSSVTAIGNLVDHIGQEANFHQMYGKGWVKSLNEKDRTTLNSSIKKRLPGILRWFGDPSVSSGDALLKEGLRTKSVKDARDHFVAVNVSLLVEQGGVSDAEVSAIVSGLDWNNWDSRKRRGAGTAMPAELWEFVLPTNQAAMITRRALRVSQTDNVLWTDNRPE